MIQNFADKYFFEIIIISKNNIYMYPLNSSNTKIKYNMSYLIFYNLDLLFKNSKNSKNEHYKKMTVYYKN